MTGPNDDLHKAQRAHQKARATYRRRPKDLEARERFLLALFREVDALLAEQLTAAAADLIAEALRESRAWESERTADPRWRIFLSDAEDRRARMLDLLRHQSEEAVRRSPGTIPDHLPPEPEEITEAWQAAIASLEPLLPRTGEDEATICERLTALHGRLAVFLDDHEHGPEAFGHYRAALMYAEKVVRQRPRDPRAKANLALSHNAIGHHYAAAEQLEDSIRHHGASRALNEWLVRHDPKDPHWRHCLGIDLENLCDAFVRANDRTRALEFAQACVRTREVLCARPDATVERRNQLADAHRDVAELSMDLNDPETALTHFRAMLGILGEVAAERPNDLDLCFRLADGQLVLGYALEDQRRLKEALAVYRSALETDGRLIALDPAEPRWKANAAHCHLCVALVLLALDSDDEAEREARAGLEMLGRELRRRPKDRGLLGDLAAFHTELAAAYADRNEPQRAIEQHRAALALDERLSELDRDDRDAIAALAATHDSLAALYERGGEFERAIEHGRIALGMEERLSATDPESVEYRTRVANARLNLASSLMQNGTPHLAHDELIAAKEHIARTARLVPKDPGVRSLAAQIDRALGDTLREVGEHQAAEKHMRRALEGISELIESASDPAPYFLPETECLEALGELQLELGRPNEAREFLTRALRRRRRLASESPDDQHAQRELAHTLESLAESCEAMGELDIANGHRAEAARLIDRFGEGPEA
ncbi:MAG: hypothetical protein AB7I19_14405 [Planctomycetota bacterium]